MKLVYIFSIAILVSSNCFGQEKLKSNQPQMKLSVDGMIGASFGKNFYTINIGGPTLFLNVHKDLKVGFGMLPSLYAENGKFGTKLGMSPRADYKNFVFMLPFFPSQPFGKWVGSVGIGYKFQKKGK